MTQTNFEEKMNHWVLCEIATHGRRSVSELVRSTIYGDTGSPIKNLAESCIEASIEYLLNRGTIALQRTGKGYVTTMAIDVHEFGESRLLIYEYQPGEHAITLGSLAQVYGVSGIKVLGWYLGSDIIRGFGLLAVSWRDIISSDAIPSSVWSDFLSFMLNLDLNDDI